MAIISPLLKAAGCGALVASATIAAMQPQSNWTQFRLDTTHNVVIGNALRANWTTVTGGPISSSPIVSGNTVYIGNNHGFVDAIDARTGRIIWSRHLSNDVMSQPLLYDGELIVGEGDEQSFGSDPSSVYVGEGTSAIVALDAQTGATKWYRNVAGSAMPTGAIINGTYVEHNGAGWITALDPSDGHILYRRYLHSIASMTAILPDGNNAFVTIGVLSNSVFKLQLNDGKTLWQTNFSAAGSGHGDCPPASDGNVMVCVYMMPVPPTKYTTPGVLAVQHAYALDLKTGAKRWDITLERGVLPIRNEASIPLIDRGVAYFGSSIAPYMHAVDVATGRVLWTQKVRGPVKGGIVAVNGRLYFGDLHGYLWSLDERTGHVVGCKRMRSGFNVDSPVAVGQTLVIGSRTGSLYAIPLQDIDNAHDG